MISIPSTSVRTCYVFVHVWADGSVACQSLCVRRSGGQLVLPELRAEVGKQERQTRLEVSGTSPRTSWKKNKLPHMFKLIISLSNKIKPLPILFPSAPAIVSSEARRERTASKSALAWTEFLLNPVPHKRCWPRFRPTSEIAWSTRCCWDSAPQSL